MAYWSYIALFRFGCLGLSAPDYIAPNSAHVWVHKYSDYNGYNLSVTPKNIAKKFQLYMCWILEAILYDLGHCRQHCI